MSTKSKKKELVKNTAILTVGKVCTQFISFLLMPLYTTILLPEEYGIVDLFATYVSLLLPLVNWMFDQGLFRFLIDVRGDKKEQRYIFSNVLEFHVIQILAYTILYSLIQPFISSQYKIFLLTNVVLYLVSGTLLQLARGVGNNAHYAIASFLSALTTIVSNIFMIIVFKLGAYGLLFSVILSQIVVIVYLIFAEKVWEYYIFIKLDKKLLKNIAKYALPLVPANLSWWVINASDRTIVSAILGVTLNGIYSVANKFSTIFITFYNIFNLSWTESVALYIDAEDRDQYLSEMINSLFNLFSAACLGLIACMPFVFPVLINEQYNSAYYQIPILMLSILFQVICGLYSAVYLAKKKSTESAKTAVFTAIINISINLILIRFIGLYAASISTLVAYAAMAIYRYIDVKKYVNARLYAKNVIFTSIVAAIDLISYYINRPILNAAVLLGVCIYAYYINKDIIMVILTKLKGKLSAERKG